MSSDGEHLQKCPVCSEDFSDTPYGKHALKDHYWRKHTEFPALAKRMGKRLALRLTPAVVVLIALLLYFAPSSQESVFYIVAGYVAFAGILTVNMGLKLRGFRRKWVEEHAVPRELA